MEDEDKPPEIIDLVALDLKKTPVLYTRPLQLSVKLTEPEWVEFVELQIAAIIEMTTLEAAEKARASVARGQHKARESEVQRLVGIVDARAEVRSVEVVDYALRDLNQCLTVRADTGEVRNRRALNAKELDKLSQQALPLTTDDELPPEPEPMPKGVKGLAEYIKAGKADHVLSALDLDTRVGVTKALAARRDVLLAGAIAEAETDEPKPAKSL